MPLDIGIKLHNIKNIVDFDYQFSFEKGIYALVGENAVGKSTVMSAIASTVYSAMITQYGKTEITNDSSIEISCLGNKDIWTCNNSIEALQCQHKRIVVFNGIYEGSIFSGTRFADMKNIDVILQNTPGFVDDFVPASEKMKEALSYILHDERGHYSELYKLRSFEIAKKYGLENMPYFLKLPDGQYISKYKMSSGECLLISLLNFINSTALMPKHLKHRKPVLAERMFIFIDEVELALHPSSIVRLIKYLEDMVRKNDLTVLFSSHSSELIRRISPDKMFYLENMNGHAQIMSPCYPQYAIRTLYDHDGYDSTILVEDSFSETIVRKLIQDFRIQNNLLINVIPVGAWNNTLSFQKRAIEQNAFGHDRFVFSIIDGDVKDEVNRSQQYNSIRKLFLPIKSVEKYIYHKLFVEPNPEFVRQFGNKYFTMTPLSVIMRQLKSRDEIVRDKTGKRLFSALCEELKKVGYTKETFVKELCEDLFVLEDFKPLKRNIEEFIRDNFYVVAKN